MIYLRTSTILVLILIGKTHGENNDSSTTDNTTDTICKSCICSNSLINCNNVKLEQFFTIPDWAGIKKENPREVLLSYNNFKNITMFPELPIERLDLSHGVIERIENSAFHFLQNMIFLDLSYNNISSENLTPDIFYGVFSPILYMPLKSMRVLNISNNNLHSLNDDLFEHIPEIEELILRGNPFTIIDHRTVIAISSLSNLKILDISSCELKKLPENFLHTPKYLERLDLSSNYLINIPPPLEEAKSLVVLNISNNPIKYVESNSSVYTQFHSMPNLRELYMCHMPQLLEIRAKSMSGLTNLKILYLHDNPVLTKIDSTAFESLDPDGEGKVWPILEELYLQHNNLSNIENMLISRWDLLKAIDIRFNPFLCDCTTQWMVNTLAPIVLRVNPDHSSFITCHEPIEMRGKSIIHLEEIHSHMRCSDAYGNRPEGDGLLLVGTLIGVLITIPILLGMLFVYKRGCFGLCGDGGPAAYSRQFYKRTNTNDML